MQSFLSISFPHRLCRVGGGGGGRGVEFFSGIAYLEIAEAVLTEPVFGAANQTPHQVFALFGHLQARLRREIEATLQQTVRQL